MAAGNRRAVEILPRGTGGHGPCCSSRAAADCDTRWPLRDPLAGPSCNGRVDLVQQPQNGSVACYCDHGHRSPPERLQPANEHVLLHDGGLGRTNDAP